MIGKGNGLVPPGNKPIPEVIFTLIYVAMVSLGRNELTNTGQIKMVVISTQHLEMHFLETIF